VFISGPSHLSYLGLKIEVNQVWWIFCFI
jgi:hypothetical protein